MSRPMKKSQSVLIGVLIAALLIGACFASVALYAKNEINKPRFRLPDAAVASVPIPSGDAAIRTYFEQLYARTVAADDVEGSWKTDVSVEGDWTAPLPDADKTVLQYIAAEACAQIGGLYPSAENVLLGGAADVPQPEAVSAAADVFGSAREGRIDEDGSLQDANRVFATVSLEHLDEEVQQAAQSEVYRAVQKTLSSLVQIRAVSVRLQRVTENYTADRVSGALLDAEFVRVFRIRAEVLPTAQTDGLLPQEPTQIELPYTTKTSVHFFFFFARFTSPVLVVRPGDEEALPAQVTVHADATKADYTLSFTTDAPDVLSIDADGVMHVRTGSPDPIGVTMTLQYDGHTYTDHLTVYITELEVASDV